MQLSPTLCTLLAIDNIPSYIHYKEIVPVQEVRRVAMIICPMIKGVTHSPEPPHCLPETELSSWSGRSSQTGKSYVQNSSTYVFLHSAQVYPNYYVTMHASTVAHKMRLLHITRYAHYRKEPLPAPFVRCRAVSCSRHAAVNCQCVVVPHYLA